MDFCRGHALIRGGTIAINTPFVKGARLLGIGTNFLSSFQTKKLLFVHVILLKKPHTSVPAGKIGKYWFDMGYILMVCMNKQEK